MSVYEKLLLLESELRVHPKALKNSPNMLSALLVESPQHFINISHFHGDKAEFINNYIGTPDTVRLNSIKTWLNDGEPVLLTNPNSRTLSGIHMALMMSGEEYIVIGEVNPTYLFGIGEISSIPPLTELSVFNGKGEVLASSVDAIERLDQLLKERAPEDHMPRFFWKNADQHYCASRKALFLEPSFKSEVWEIVLSQPLSEFYSAMNSFKKLFPLIVLLSVMSMIWASIVSIRRNTGSVEILTNAVDQVARGKFSHQVHISTKDEFEVLGQAFNRMTLQLRYQFEKISVQAQINKAVSASQRVGVFIVESLEAVSQFVPFQKAIVVLSEPDHKFARYQILDEMIDSFCVQPSWQKINQDKESIAKILKDIFSDRHIWTGELNEIVEALKLHNGKEIPQFRDNSNCCALSLSQNGQPIGAILLVGVKGLLDENRKDFYKTVTINMSIGVAKILSLNQLQESQDRFRTTFENAASGLLIFNSDGSIIQCNSFMSQMSGYPEETLYKSNVYDLICSSETEKMSDACQRILERKQSYDLFEQQFLNKDGRIIWAMVSLSLVRNESTEPLYFIALLQDITSEKQSAKERAYLQEQLHQAQKMEAIGTLAGGIAHDFNNILAAILGYVELAKMEAKPGDSIKGRLERIESAALRATDLVLQILTFSRKGEQNLQYMNLSPIIKEATKLLRATMPKNVSLQLNIKEDGEKVLADVSQIHQVIMNLCTNAIHACEENGGSVEVILDNQMIPAGISNQNLDLKPGNYLKLSVSDTGCGIDKIDLVTIFDPFFTTKGKGKGTGLGLSVVHGIVKSHKGGIKVFSDPGKGATFEIYLPVAEANCDEQPEKRNDDLPIGKERILFVDDETMLANIVEGQLSSLGYKVACFTDPNQALNYFVSDIDNIDLVITDHDMPGINGIQLARKLTQQRSDLPILLITGHLDQVNNEQLAKAGVQIMVNKPLRMPQLARHVRELLDCSKSSQEVLVG